MGAFKVLDNKSILKLKMGNFIPLFLVRFPYNYLKQNERFKLYVILEIVKCGFWSKTSSFGGTFVAHLAFNARLGSPKITISQFIT